MHSIWAVVGDIGLSVVYLLLTVSLLAAVIAPERVTLVLTRLPLWWRRWVFLMLALSTVWLSARFGAEAWVRVVGKAIGANVVG